MSGDGWRQGVEWDGRTPPSGVVAGLRRDFTCNVSKTKNRIAPRNVVPTPNAKSRLRPLGGLKPALRPPSGVNAGFVKRHQCWARQAGIFPFPRLRGKVPAWRKGGMKLPSDVNAGFAKAASLLGFTAASLAFETLQALSLHFSFCHNAAVLFQKLPSGVDTGSSSSMVTGFRREVACNSQKRKAVLRRAMSFLPQMQKAGCARSAG